MRTILCGIIMLVVASMSLAAEPCRPFLERNVDANILHTMQAAAREGRLLRVVPGKSRVGFCVRHFPLQEFRGEFTQLVGGLALPPDNNSHGQALLLIHTESMVPSNPSLAPLVHGYQFMDTERFPEILFTGHTFQWVDTHHAHIFGDITIHGMTRPVVFDIDVDVADAVGNRPGRIRLNGKGQINRARFGMHGYRFLVSETVRLCLDVELVRWGL